MPSVEAFTTLIGATRTVEAFTVIAESKTVEAFTVLDPPTYALGYEISDDQQHLIVYNDTDLTQDGLPASLGLNVSNIRNQSNLSYCEVLPYPDPSVGVLAWTVKLAGNGPYLLQLINETSREQISGVDFPISLGTQVYYTSALVNITNQNLLDTQLIGNANLALIGTPCIDYREQLLVQVMKNGIEGEFYGILNGTVVDLSNFILKQTRIEDTFNFPEIENR